MVSHAIFAATQRRKQSETPGEESTEEKERLRVETARLQGLQSSLEAERTALQKRVDDELRMLQDRTRTFEETSRRAHEDRRVQEASVHEAQRKLEAERNEFASYISASSRAAEDSLANLRAEEARLNAIRDELSRERAAFDQRKFEI